MLKAALRYKRIQVTEYRSIQTDHFGKLQSHCFYIILLYHIRPNQLFLNNNVCLFGRIYILDIRFSCLVQLNTKQLSNVLSVKPSAILSELPLKIAYPPNFSESRTYALLLMM